MCKGEELLSCTQYTYTYQYTDTVTLIRDASEVNYHTALYCAERRRSVKIFCLEQVKIRNLFGPADIQTVHACQSMS
jgi:hypothetical protein